MTVTFDYCGGERKVSLRKTQNRGVSAVLAAVVASLFAALPAAAQYPGQVSEKNPNAPELRSVAVLEWTGDLAHPKASRLVPLSVYDGQQLQDGDLYLARPQPLALDGETEYELQKDGRNVGFYIVNDASETQGAWYGQGAFQPLPKRPSPAQLARGAARQKVDMDDADSDVPILHRKFHPDEAGGGSGSGSTSNSSGPTLHKGGDTSANDSGSANAPAPDPDRPRLHADDDSANSKSSSAPADPDRPKLQSKPDDDEGRVEDLPNISDPDRPRLRRGVPAEYGPSVKPTLMGVPPEMEQEVAVSDAQAVKEHPWDFSWSNPADETKMKADLEDIARKALGLEQPAPAPKPKATAHRTSVHRKTTPPPPPAPLLDEQFRVFELQYGGGATMVFSAHTAGTGEDQKFVTLIAQPDLYGNVVVLLKNVTDAAHLDVTPRMRLVDAVDALADNRGELLFELRGQTQRQFALYRVLRGEATKIFTSDPLYWSAVATQ